MNKPLVPPIMAALIACPAAGCTQWAYNHLGGDDDTAESGTGATANGSATAIADPTASTSGLETGMDDSMATATTLLTSPASGEDTGPLSDSPCGAGQVALSDDGNICVSIADVRFVFVTSEEMDGDFGYPADMKCQDLANSSDYLQGTFKAWVSGLSSPLLDSGFDKGFKGSYVKLDLTDDPNWDRRRVTRVAEGWAELTSGALRTAINVTERGHVVYGKGEFAWTGTTPSGTVSMYPQTLDTVLCGIVWPWSVSGSECSDKDNVVYGDFGAVGKIGAVDATWTELWPGEDDELSCGADVVQKYLCHSRHRIYCIQS